MQLERPHFEFNDVNKGCFYTIFSPSLLFKRFQPWFLVIDSVTFTIDFKKHFSQLNVKRLWVMAERDLAFQSKKLKFLLKLRPLNKILKITSLFYCSTASKHWSSLETTKAFNCSFRLDAVLVSLSCAIG